MSRTIASGVRSTMTKIAVTGALIAVTATSMTVPANAMPDFVGTSGTPVPLDDPNPGPGSDVPTNPLDPKCAQMPTFATCQGGGPDWQGPPTSPFDPQCATMPADAACVGGPYALQPPTDLPPPPAPPIEAPLPPRGPLAGPLNHR
jgi:hypothetical protein